MNTMELNKTELDYINGGKISGSISADNPLPNHGWPIDLGPITHLAEKDKQNERDPVLLNRPFPSPIHIKTCTFEGNHTSSSGGAIYFY